MFTVSLMLATVLADSSCTGNGIVGCLLDDNCDWYPSSEQCLLPCYRSNQTECENNPACHWGGFSCNMVWESKCEDKPLDHCNGECGVVTGENICRNCTIPTTKLECGRSSCNWDSAAGKCGSLPQCYDFKNATTCMENNCIWRDSPSYSYCQSPYPSPDTMCQGTNTTNCIRYKNDLAPCSSLNQERLCAMQANCFWYPFTQTCTDTDMCNNIHDNCEAVGCTTLANMCTSAKAFSQCEDINDIDVCNRLNTCAYIATNSTSGMCRPHSGCRGLPRETCDNKEACEWSNTTINCEFSTAKTCSNLKMICAGKTCKNLVTFPEDASQFTIPIDGFYFDGQLVTSIEGNSMLMMPNGQPCYGCPVCGPGFVVNVGATISCSSDGTASFVQQLCVLPGQYSDGSGTPDSPDNSSGDSDSKMIIIILACVIVFVALLIFIAVKLCNKKNAEKHSNLTTELN